MCAAAGSNLAAAPNLSERGRRGSGPPGGGQGGGPRGDPSLPKVLWKRTLRQLSSLPLAIGELAVIAVLSSLGTIIEQNKPLEFYQQVLPAVTSFKPPVLGALVSIQPVDQVLYFDFVALRLPELAKLKSNEEWKLPGAQFYPDGANKVIGFVDWRLIQATQLDHIYTAGYFLGLLGLLGASLAACTATRQWPAVRVARRCAAAG